MTTSHLCYYKDVAFQLELNLENTRRDLVNLLEEDKFHDCFALESSDSAFPNKNDIYYIAAPPADSLPTPRWVEKTSSVLVNESSKTLNWIRASLPNRTQFSRVSFPVPGNVLAHINYSWPPFPNSIWSYETLKETTARERALCGEPEGGGHGTVATFFRYFTEKRAIPNTAIAR